MGAKIKYSIENKNKKIIQRTKRQEKVEIMRGNKVKISGSNQEFLQPTHRNSRKKSVEKIAMWEQVDSEEIIQECFFKLKPIDY